MAPKGDLAFCGQAGLKVLEFVAVLQRQYLVRKRKKNHTAKGPSINDVASGDRKGRG